jgi:hypothetical protein
MILVAALSQFQAQFGGNDTATTVCRITGDSDLHVRGGRLLVPVIRWLEWAVVADFTRVASAEDATAAIRR